ncbi:MAG: hypothetical protein LBF89_12135 [Bacteroidales bacterium]|nr:hypothetical protein [Bacteroidales bacterium]
MKNNSSDLHIARRHECRGARRAPESAKAILWRMQNVLQGRLCKSQQYK